MMPPVWVYAFLMLFLGMMLTGVVFILSITWFRTKAFLNTLIAVDRGRKTHYLVRSVGWFAVTALAGGVAVVLVMNLIRIGGQLWQAW